MLQWWWHDLLLHCCSTLGRVVRKSSGRNQQCVKTVCCFWFVVSLYSFYIKWCMLVLDTRPCLGPFSGKCLFPESCLSLSEKTFVQILTWTWMWVHCPQIQKEGRRGLAFCTFTKSSCSTCPQKINFIFNFILFKLASQLQISKYREEKKTNLHPHWSNNNFYLFPFSPPPPPICISQHSVFSDEQTQCSV